MKIARQLLKENNLSITEGRLKILQMFLSNDEALSHADIDKKAGNQFDRVTVYRTLQAFMEKGIIHSIPSADNLIKYALCKDDCTEGHHHDHHIHLVCDHCHHTFCLEEVSMPAVYFPSGYQVSTVEIIARGLCRNCAA